eukprot:358897-Chlamydomonas_euryale.AAC.2
MDSELTLSNRTPPHHTPSQSTHNRPAAANARRPCATATSSSLSAASSWLSTATHPCPLSWHTCLPHFLALNRDSPLPSFLAHLPPTLAHVTHCQQVLKHAVRLNSYGNMASNLPLAPSMPHPPTLVDASHRQHILKRAGLQHGAEVARCAIRPAGDGRRRCMAAQSALALPCGASSACGMQCTCGARVGERLGWLGR